MSITRLQSAKNTGTHTCSVTWATQGGTGNTTAGSLLSAVVIENGSNGTFGAITAPASWVQGPTKQGTVGADGQIQIWYYLGAPSQASTGNFTTSQAANGLIVEVEEVSGLVSGGVLDKSTNAIGSGTPVSSGTTSATTNANEYIVAGISATNSIQNGTFSAATNSFSIQQQMADINGELQGALLSKVVAATGTQQAGATFSGAGISYVGVIATFMDGASPAGTLVRARPKRAPREPRPAYQWCQIIDDLRTGRFFNPERIRFAGAHILERR